MNKETQVPPSLEPNPLNLPEKYNDLVKTLRNNGQTYVHMLTENTYTMRELYSQVTSWLNNVDFLRPTLQDCVWYSEIVESEDVLKGQLDHFERAEAVDSVEGPGEKMLNGDYDTNKLGDVLYDDACHLLQRVTAGDNNVRRLCFDIHVWMCEFKQHEDELEHHNRIVHIRDICTRLNDFLRGVDRAGDLLNEENKTDLLNTGTEILTQFAQTVSVMQKWLDKFDQVDSNCVTAMGPELMNLYHRIENYVVGTRNVGEITCKLEQLTEKYECCKQHVKHPQEQIAEKSGIETFDSHKELKKETLQLIKNLCTLLEHN